MVVPFEKAEPCEVRGGGVKRSEAKRGYGYSRWRASSDFWGMDCMREKKRERERERERGWKREIEGAKTLLSMCTYLSMLFEKAICFSWPIHPDFGKSR